MAISLSLHSCGYSSSSFKENPTKYFVYTLWRGASLGVRRTRTTTTTNTSPNYSRCRAMIIQSDQFIPNQRRRSANFQPSSWNHDFLQSIGIHDFEQQVYEERGKKLEEEVRLMINNENFEPSDLLELIRDVHRLGLDYRYRESIKKALDKLLASEGASESINKSLNSTALYFKLLRLHGYEVSTDAFESFKDEAGNFNIKQRLSDDDEDVKGMVSLYEASHLAYEGEKILDDAKAFTITYLHNIIITSAKGNDACAVVEEARHALELPSHHRMPRLEASWYIQEYSKRTSLDAQQQSLLGLAKLDFNRVQSTLQRDLKDVSRWWRGIGLCEKLSFARDRIMESFFWSVGMVFEPQFSESRKAAAKAFALVTVIDDVYDVYGSPDELDLFTHAVERWDINAVEELPDYMKLCFLALYNTVNDLSYITLKEHGQVVIPYLKKAWADLCKAFLQEAKWSNKKDSRRPSLEEYLNNAWVSVSGCVLLIHAYYLMPQNTLRNEAVNGLQNYHDLLRLPSIIFRLCNDLSTSTAELARGETTNAIACYMYETGCSEEQAREYLRDLIHQTWKKMNRELVSLDTSPFGRSFVETAFNLGRISESQYQYGDGHGDPDARARSRVLAVIIDPFELEEKDKIDLESEKLEIFVNNK